MTDPVNVSSDRKLPALRWCSPLMLVMVGGSLGCGTQDPDTGEERAEWRAHHGHGHHDHGHHRTSRACDVDIADPPPGIPMDPCASGTLVFGPRNLHRSSTEQFNVTGGESFCVRVTGDAREVTLDGATLLGRRELRGHSRVVEARPDLEPGSHELGVSLAGRRGRATVEVYASPTPDVPRPAGISLRGLINAANLYDWPDPLTPNGDGVDDLSELGVDVQVPGVAARGKGHHKHRQLRAEFLIFSPAGCGLVRRLVTTAEVEGGTQRLTVSWDGRDNRHRLVDDGEYLYLAKVTLLELHKRHGQRKARELDKLRTHAQRINVVSAPQCIASVDCDDGTPCTDDVCVLGACEHAPSPTACGPNGEPFVPNQLIVRFKPDHGLADQMSAIATISGTLKGRIESSRLALVEVPDGTDLETAQAAILATGSANLAIPNGVVEDYVDPNDTLYASDQWSMDLTPPQATGEPDVADIDAPDAWDITNSAPQSIIAVVDRGMDWAHPDLQNQIWQNNLECCDAPPCTTPCAVTAACPTGEQDSPPDGCPGGCGVDDDADGLADLADPQVLNITRNGRDDDGDGNIDEAGPGGASCDTVASIPAGTAADQDCDGVAADDDENGYLDDCKGFDFAGFDNDPRWDQLGTLTASFDHGIHVAGTVGATGNDSTGVAGVNWNAQIMVLHRGQNAFDTAEAYAYAANNGADAINASHGLPVASADAADELLRATNSRQTLLVAAAGNDSANLDPGGGALLRFPRASNLPTVVNVAATDIADNMAGFSAFGATTVDFGAPGVSIISDVVSTNAGVACISGTAVTGYSCKSGTSMAAPHVAGLASLIVGTFDGPGSPMAGNPRRIIDTISNNVEVTAALTGQVVTNGRINACRSLGGCGGTGAAAPTLFVERTRERLPRAFIDVPTYEVDLFDADQDSDLDALQIMCSHEGALTQPLLFINQGVNSGTFVNGTASALPMVGRNQCGAETADFDGDGDMDILAAGFGQADVAERQDRLYLNNGSGVFSDATTNLPTDAVISRDADACDVDGDGDLDVVISGVNQVSVYINNGSAVFTDETSTRVPSLTIDSHNAACSDLTGDGFPDIFATGQFTQNVLLVNDGTGIFTDQTVVRGIPISVSEYTHDAELVDVTGDSAPDIVLAIRLSAQNRLLVNDGVGNFTDETGTRMPMFLDTTTEIDAADVDNDGDLDLLILNGNPNVPQAEQSRLYANDGTGVFADMSAAWGMPIGAIEMSTDGAFGDIDGDSDIDVLIANWGSPTYLLVNTFVP